MSKSEYEPLIPIAPFSPLRMIIVATVVFMIAKLARLPKSDVGYAPIPTFSHSLLLSTVLDHAKVWLLGWRSHTKPVSLSITALSLKLFSSLNRRRAFIDPSVPATAYSWHLCLSS
jgi:hypothetical protein